MTKLDRLKLCDRTLLTATVAILASGIQLEATHSRGIAPVVIHILLGAAFCGLGLWHIYLHYGSDNWFVRFRRQKKQAVRILWWVFLLTLLTGLAAMIHWFTDFAHSPLGGVHGKIGFLAMILSAMHFAKRYRFMLPKAR